MVIRRLLEDVAGPQSIGRGPGTQRRTVLLTGASGVVGRALLQRLRDFDVICLVHRSPVYGPNVTTVPGDIAEPMFGLAERDYLDLAAKVRRQGFDWRAHFDHFRDTGRTTRPRMWTHGVNLAMGLKEPAVWYRHSGDAGDP